MAIKEMFEKGDLVKIKHHTHQFSLHYAIILEIKKSHKNNLNIWKENYCLCFVNNQIKLVPTSFISKV